MYKVTAFIEYEYLAMNIYVSYNWVRVVSISRSL